MKMPPWDRSKGSPEPIRALNRVVERDGGEPLVDLRPICPDVRMIRPQVIPYVRLGVAEALHRASQALPPGVHLGLIEGWRPLARQQRIYDFWWRSAKEAYPDRSPASLRRTVCRLVAPTDQKAPPGHCTGGAVDVWLIDAAGEPLDVTSPYRWIEATRTYVLGLSEAAQRNRDLLVSVMLDQGFSNCRDEWWHYSLGDAGWAVRMGLPECYYGLADLPEDIYAEAETLSEEKMQERPNPFLMAS